MLQCNAAIESNLIWSENLYQPLTVHRLLGPLFFAPVQSAVFPSYRLRFRNQSWAERVGLGDLNETQWIHHFGQFTPLKDNLNEPLALKYHGHQFRHYNPDIGDGRGFLFAQLRDPQTNKILDLGTKGSGRTPYSRTGDGRLTLKGAVREALATEYLEALDVTTSKTFSIIETGENLTRHDEPSPTRSAVLVRLSHSHIRFGTFQRLLHESNRPALRLLVEHSCRHYYENLDLNDPQLFLTFFSQVVRESARLCAEWMIAGFVHGVLNSDNMVITGESFDYGPYRVLPKLDPRFTAAYFDHSGLYCYGRQPEAVYWNLTQLASTLAFVEFDVESYFEQLGELFPKELESHLVRLFLKRLQLKSRTPQEDRQLYDIGFQFLYESQMPFANFFDDWRGGYTLETEHGVSANFYQGSTFQLWSEKLKKFSASDGFSHKAKGPDLLIETVEKVWEAIASHDDWSLFEKTIENFRNWKRSRP